MFEVLVYLFENYFEVDVHPDPSTLKNELFAAGFDSADITGAVDWFEALDKMSERADGLNQLPEMGGFRIYAPEESKKISAECLSFVLFLEQARILNATQREMIIDRALALPQPEVRIEEMRWIVLMALWKQGKARDYLFVEDAMFGKDVPTLH